MEKMKVLFLSLVLFTLVITGCVNENSDSGEGVKVVRDGNNVSVYAKEVAAAYEVGIDVSEVESIKSDDLLLDLGNKIVVAKNKGSFVKGELIFRLKNVKGDAVVNLLESIKEVEMAVNVTRAEDVLLGDFNGDNEVAINDLSSFANVYGFASRYDANYDIAPAVKGSGDFAGIYSQVNKDGAINLSDFLIFARNFGKTITVEKTVVSVSVSGVSSVEVGANVPLSATVTYSDDTTGTSVAWSSSDSSIATVSNGTVTGIKAGSVTITAEKDGKNGTKNITVNPIQETGITVHVEKPSGWSAIYIWYDENSDDVWETKALGTAPGDMVDEGDGWFKKSLPNANSVAFLFNDGTWNNKIEGSGDNFSAVADIWIDASGNVVTEPEPQPPVVNVSPSSKTFRETITVNITVESTEALTEKVYILNGVETAMTSNSETVTIGQFMVDKEVATIKVRATNAIGTTTSAVYSYTKDTNVVPVPENDIDNLRIFQVMVCSFMSGDPSIGYDWQWAGYRADGDLQGVINSLDYIKGLGMNAVWMTPVFTTNDGQQAHNGYFANDYFNIDPKFGTNDKFRELVDTAHEKGMYIILDGVLGHNAGWASPSPLSGKSPNGSNPVNYQDGGDSLQFYKDVVYHWIREYKIDGWRFDQSYQLGPGNDEHQGQGGSNFYWDDIRLEIEKAVEENKNDGDKWGILGYTVGEDWEDDEGMALNTYGTTDEGLHSAFDFTTRYKVVQTFAREEYAKEINDASNLEIDHSAFPEWAHPNLMIGNHDLARFGDLIDFSTTHNNNYWKRHKAAISYMGAYSGPITLYYGEEWGSKTGNSDLKSMHVSRNDGKISGFNTEEQDLVDYTKRVMEIRANNSALWQEDTSSSVVADGNTYIDIKEDSSTGNKVVFCVNIGTDSETFNVSVSGTLRDAMSGETFTGSVPMEGLQARFLIVE